MEFQPKFIPPPPGAAPLSKEDREHAYALTRAASVWSLGIIRAAANGDAQGIKEGLAFVEEKDFGMACILALINHINHLVGVCQENDIETMFNNIDGDTIDAFEAMINVILEAAEKSFELADNAIDN